MKRLPWTKLPHSVFVDEDAAELGLPAAYLRIFMLRYCMSLDGKMVDELPADEAIGWLVTETGRSYTVETIRRMTPMTADQIEEALFELEEVGIIVRSDDGCYGYVGWKWTQESPTTERTRRYREREKAKAERSGNADGNATGTPRERAEEKRPEEKKTKKREAPAEPVALPGLLIEERPWEEEIVGLWHELRVDLGLADDTDRPAKLTDKRRQQVNRAGPAEEWRVVLRRMAQRIRNEAERAKVPASMVSSALYFNLDHLCKPKNRALYLDAPTLDRTCRPNRDLAGMKRAPVGGMDLDEAERLMKGR
ncbi:MAG: hypothetical protein EKK62_11190 [Acidimicrobiia bacterium]|nr:MAG: hypothetical protein EKK62_11190 [Acidimicrobiia bacterium]